MMELQERWEVLGREDGREAVTMRMDEQEESFVMSRPCCKGRSNQPVRVNPENKEKSDNGIPAGRMSGEYTVLFEDGVRLR